MDILVGYTGFVGQNINCEHNFSHVFNSTNIKDAFGLNPDLCVYSGVKSEKFKADKFPDEDLFHIKKALENIQSINPKNLVLISTVDVIPSNPGYDVFEYTTYSTETLTPYGKNRLFLETEIRKLFSDALIVRLPALFGQGLKKNFIYDLIKYVPAMLKKEKFNELSNQDSKLLDFYNVDESGFYRLNANIANDEREYLKKIFKKLGFSALNFTDSRCVFSFYNLKYLWSHINILLKNNITLAHMANEPLSVSEIYEAIYGSSFANEIQAQPFNYNFFKTTHCKLFGAAENYIYNKNAILDEIVEFVNLQTKGGIKK